MVISEKNEKHFEPVTTKLGNYLFVYLGIRVIREKKCGLFFLLSDSRKDIRYWKTKREKKKLDSLYDRLKAIY